MTTIRNIFACLVHESPACVIDLVRNLHHLDPSSRILLYNGGKNPDLLDTRFPLERYGVLVHPRPRPQAWGKLHDFALASMQFALAHHPFDTLTIVDSDQLALRPGYSDCLSRFLMQHPDAGLLGCAADVQPADTKEGPAAAAYREIGLWRPFLRRFQNGEHKYVHWTFWPTTVITVDAARELVKICVEDTQFGKLMQQTRIWATEEIIFPTLVALLGFKIARNPCSYDYVKYQTSYSPEQIDAACGRADVYWVHPVPRKYDNPIRQHVRTAFNHYTKAFPRAEAASAGRIPSPDLLLHWPILNRMKTINGWLEEDEADLLMAAASRVLAKFPKPHAVVEVGSYCGRSTVVLGSVVKALGSEVKVHAIDPHQGRVGALDRGIKAGTSTLKMFRRNIMAAGLGDVVEAIQAYSFDVKWDMPIQFLLIDGLHDYINVARDFYHFEPWIVPGGYVAFHDYADYYPGVKAFVNEILSNGEYGVVFHVRSMMVIERLVERQTAAFYPPARREDERSRAASFPEDVRDPRASDEKAIVGGRRPMASCIMPTCNRRPFVGRAIQFFLRQTYHPRELLIVDDGEDSVSDLIPDDSRIRYLRLDKKLSLGAKRNMACRAAAGDIIVHWDDDDWMADHRLNYQVDALLKSRADVCGLDRLLYFEPGTNRSWQYIYPKKGTQLLAGGSLCYLKQIWENSPFPEINVGEDTRFVWSKRPKKLLPLMDNAFYIALIHPGNTNPRNTADRRWRPWDTGKIRDLIGEDWDFYQGLHAAENDRKKTLGSNLAARIEVIGDKPLVSCIMPTADRRRFLRRAITYFRRQKYPKKELVIVDDGTVDVGDLIPPGDRIRYLRLNRKATVGYKRNFAVQHSEGEMIAHWDDDDWYAPDRLGLQVEAMLAHGAPVCGLETGYFYDVCGNRFWSCSPALHARMFFADVNGRSIMYAKALWENDTRYPDVSLAEDALFLTKLLKRNVKISRLENRNQLIYIRHAANAWRFECGKFMNPGGWQPLQTPSFFSSEDALFYQALRKDNRIGAHKVKSEKNPPAHQRRH